MRFPGKCRRTSTDPLFLISVSMGGRLEKRSPIFIGGTKIRNRVDMHTHDLPFGERSKISKPRCDPLHAPGERQALERTTSRGNHGNAQKRPGTILVRIFRRKFNRTVPRRMGAPVNPPRTHKCRWREKCHRKQSSTPMHAARASPVQRWWPLSVISMMASPPLPGDSCSHFMNHDSARPIRSFGGTGT